MDKHSSNNGKSLYPAKPLPVVRSAALIMLAVLTAVVLCAAGCAAGRGSEEAEAYASDSQSATYSPMETSSPTAVSTEEQTHVPSATDAAEPSPAATCTPTAAPTAAETSAPTATATATATAAPTASPAPTTPPRTDGPILNAAVTYPSRGVGVTALVCMPQTNGEPCPVVVMAHGFGGSKNCGGGFARIAEALYRQGIASIRIDFSGCGDSVESSLNYCLTEMRTDIANAISHVTSVYNVDSSRVGLLGYSMGGRAVLETLAAGAASPDAVLLIAPAASTTDFIRLAGGQSAWDRMRGEAQQTGSTLLMDMELGYGFFEEMEARESPTQAAAENYHGRMGVIYSTNDAAVLPSVSLSVAEAFDCEKLILEGCGHAYGMYSGSADNQYITAVIQFALRMFG